MYVKRSVLYIFHFFRLLDTVIECKYIPWHTYKIQGIIYKIYYHRQCVRIILYSITSTRVINKSQSLSAFFRYIISISPRVLFPVDFLSLSLDLFLYPDSYL